MSDEQGKIAMPDDADAPPPENGTVTERGRARGREDQQYVPVIVKRSDEVRRHPDDSLERAIEDGLEQLGRPTLSVLLSSVAAGLIVGFSAMAAAVVTQAAAPLDSAFLTRLATAFVYPLGFVVCVMSGAQLYTEHTATALYPVLDHRASVRMLIRLWSLIIIGNLVGAAITGGLLTLADPVIHAYSGYVAIGNHLVQHDVLPLLISAILAGWLMALGAWLVSSTLPDFSQVAVIYIATFLIGLGGLHHSIAGSAEMFTALMITDQFTLIQGSRFVAIALLGNLIGGSFFVGVLNYTHIRQTQPADEDIQTH